MPPWNIFWWHFLLVGTVFLRLSRGKLIKSMAALPWLSFRRIHFTPDLMPSDFIGGDILEQATETGRRSFRFQTVLPFTQMLLADEINRTPSKTQAALLEAMGELQVTSGDVTRGLPRPFFVLATQNRLELRGTYPLPDAECASRNRHSAAKAQTTLRMGGLPWGRHLPSRRPTFRKRGVCAHNDHSCLFVVLPSTHRGNSLLKNRFR